MYSWISLFFKKRNIISIVNTCHYHYWQYNQCYYWFSYYWFCYSYSCHHQILPPTYPSLPNPFHSPLLSQTHFGLPQDRGPLIKALQHLRFCVAPRLRRDGGVFSSPNREKLGPQSVDLTLLWKIPTILYYTRFNNISHGIWWYDHRTIAGWFSAKSGFSLLEGNTEALVPTAPGLCWICFRL